MTRAKRNVVNMGLLNIIGVLIFYAFSRWLLKGIVLSSLTLEGTIFILVCSIIPALLWLSFFYLLDRKEREPVTYVALAFTCGILGFLFVKCFISDILLDLPSWPLNENGYPWLHVFVERAAIPVLTVYLIVRFVFFPTAEFDEPVDGMMYGAFTGIGFGLATALGTAFDAGEVSLYFLIVNLLIKLAIMSSLSAMIGYFFGFARFLTYKKNIYFFQTLILSLIVFSLYAFLDYKFKMNLTTTSDFYTIILTLAFTVVTLTIVYFLIQRTIEDYNNITLDPLPLKMDVTTALALIVFLAMGLGIRANLEKDGTFSAPDGTCSFCIPAAFHFTGEKNGVLGFRRQIEGSNFPVRLKVTRLQPAKDSVLPPEDEGIVEISGYGVKADHYQKVCFPEGMEDTAYTAYGHQYTARGKGRHLVIAVESPRMAERSARDLAISILKNYEEDSASDNSLRAEPASRVSDEIIASEKEDSSETIIPEIEDTSPDSASQSGMTDRVSDETIASVVKLSKVYDVFIVEGLPEKHEVRVEYGEPNFGGGRVVGRETIFKHVGSGVIITKNGWIMTNAHVADSDGPESIQIKRAISKGEPVIDKSGNPVKVVLIPHFKSYLWVTATDVDQIRNNQRKAELAYVANIKYVDKKWWHHERDRALIKITGHARLHPEANLPEKTDDLEEDETFPVSTLGNPFQIPIRKPMIKSIGYPGIGPQQFPTLTSGEYLGASNDKMAHILHTAFIAGGNSGGGLYYNNCLIGINTWSKSDHGTGRRLSVSQPNTYWGLPFAACMLWHKANELPDIPSDWIQADPSEDSYKNIVYVGINVRSAVNEKVAIRTGKIMIFKKEVGLQNARDYLAFMDKINEFVTVKRMDQQDIEHEKIADTLDIDLARVNRLAQMKKEDFRETSSGEEKVFLNLIENDEFYAETWGIDKDGQALIRIPPEGEYGVCVLSPGYRDDVHTYKADNKIIQGPWLLKATPQ